VAGGQDFGFERHQLVQRESPGIKVAILGAADGIEVREGSVEIISTEQGLLVRIPDNHVVRGFARRNNQLKL